MSFVSIKAKIKEKLESIASIQQVEDYPTEDFNGFPAAMVASARLEADFETTEENKRTYVFAVYVLQEINNKDERKARNIVEATVDDIIEDFDKDQQLSDISLPSGETMIISFPVLSSIDTGPGGRYVEGILEIKVVISFDTNV